MTLLRTIVCCCFVMLTSTVVARADIIKPAADAPQPMSPIESAAKIRLPKGFRIELVASEPLVQDPSCLAFDERGRLFVCELHGYNIEGHLDVVELNKKGVLDTKVRRLRWELMGGKIAEEAAKLQYGVVKLLTDTDGDGLMDNASIWADDLPPCYGVIPARGGIIVVAAPDIVFMADRDGDGRPEVRETLFTGFRTRVLERGINNPRWGLDNWIYVGAGGEGSTIRGPHLEESVELHHSDFRIKSDGSAIEPVTGRVGTFGLALNSHGDRFPCSGGQPAVYALPLPHNYFIRNPHVAAPRTNHSAANYTRGFRISQPHPWRVRRRQDPAWIKFYGDRETDSNYFTGGCGGEIYNANLFDEQYHGNFFYCEPSLNIVHRCVLARKGPGYQAHRAPGEDQSEFLASTDQWFRPINLRTGPDGALYIVDMYREIVEDYSAIPRFLQQQYGLDKGSDKGRIWRLVPEDAKYRRPKDFSKLSPSQLVELTGDASLWNRVTAQRLLVEADAKSVTPQLVKRARQSKSPLARLHALHTLEGVDALRSEDLLVALCDEDYRLRLHALRFASRSLSQDRDLAAAVMSMTDETDPSVRLQLALTLGEVRDADTSSALLKLAAAGDQRWMNAAILSSVNESAGRLLEVLLQSQQLNDGQIEMLSPLAATIAGHRDERAITRVVELLATAVERVQMQCLVGLVDGLSRGEASISKSSDKHGGFEVLLRSNSDDVVQHAVRLAGKLLPQDSPLLSQAFAKAVQTATNPNESVERKRWAIELLGDAPYETLATTAGELLSSRYPPAIQRAAIRALDRSDVPEVAVLLLSAWPGYTPEIRSAVLKTVLNRENRWQVLLAAIKSGVILPGSLSESQREQLTKGRDPEVSAQARTILSSSTTSDAQLQQRIGEYQRALPENRDIDRGQLVFTKHCLACHKLDKEGHDVGPALGSITNKPDEAILQDVLDPSSHIESEYTAYIVITNQGKTFTGVLASESPTSVTLRMEKGQSESILRSEIELMQASTVSLMPSNLHEQISPQEAADMLAFLRMAFGRTQRP